MKKFTLTRDNIQYVFSRSIITEKPRGKAEVSYFDHIKLIRVLNKDTGEETDPEKHKAALSLNAWTSLINDIRVSSCAICGELCDKDGCKDRRYHIGVKK